MRIPKKIGEPQVVWQGPYPNKIVSDQAFEFPNGNTEHFFMWGKTSQKPVVVFPVTSDGLAIVTRQWRPGSDGIIYELAGGHRDPGQTMESALANELRQEIGYEAGRIIALPEFWLDAPSNQVVVAGYLALDCVKVGDPVPEKSEVIEKVEISIKNWIALSQSQGLNQKDAKTLAIMWLALPYLAQAGFISFSF